MSRLPTPAWPPSMQVYSTVALATLIRPVAVSRMIESRTVSALEAPLLCSPSPQLSWARAEDPTLGVHPHHPTVHTFRADF